MKLFAIRDRLLDYFQQPMAFASAQEVLSRLATNVNHQEAVNEIAQAPHHFELWQIAEVDEQGHVKEVRELIANCSSLIRSGVRERTVQNPASAPLPASGSTGTPPVVPGRTPPQGGPYIEQDTHSAWGTTEGTSETS